MYSVDIRSITIYIDDERHDFIWIKLLLYELKAICIEV